MSPISEANMKLYPGGSIRSPEWLAIRDRIKARADNKCEQCGIENYAFGWRDFGGQFHHHPISAERMFGRRYFKIVCTVAHLDQKLTDHSDENLRFLCQQCHNRHDAADRRINASLTLRDKKAGTKDMFGRSQ